MANQFSKYDFELILNFEGKKNPIEAFEQMAKIFNKLIDIDKTILYNIIPNAKIDYELADLEFGSIKSKIVQLLYSVPDDLLKEIASPKKIIGLLLVYVKHRFLKAIEVNEVSSKKQLEKITDDINNKINEISNPNTLILNVNNYFVLNSINDLGLECKKLKNNESYEYISKNGKIRIENAQMINMPKILYELGDQKIEQNRVEVLKVKSLDLLSDHANWKLIRLGKQIDVKILDKEWLDNYHNRNIVIQPNDFLRVDLKIIYITNTAKSKPIIHYEALKVIEVIPPDKMETDTQSKLF